MATVCKNPKEKCQGGSLKLTPRPTAASMARAARNATNRNLNMATARQSPTRPSPPPGKGRPLPAQNIPKTDSKVSLKGNQLLKSEIPESDRINTDTANHVPFCNESYVIEENESSIMIIEEVDGKVHCEMALLQDDNCSAKHEDNITNGDNGGRIKSEYNRNITTVHNSRPNTPKANTSRPQTPRLQSRLNTPNDEHAQQMVLSRPTTPCRYTPRPVTPSSRPTTPGRKGPAANRPKTPGSIVLQLSQAPHNLPSEQHTMEPCINSSDLKDAFLEKRKEFQQLKKDLDLKQQAVLEVFEGLRNLRDQMTREGFAGAGEGSQQELVLFNVADWAAEEITQLCRDAAAASSGIGVEDLFKNIHSSDDNYVEQIASKVNDIPTQFADLCIQAFTTRQEIIDWVKDYLSATDKGSEEALEKIGYYNTQGLELCESLRELKVRTDNVVDHATQCLKRTYHERNILLGAGENLIREMAKIKIELDNQTKHIIFIREGGEGGAMKALEEARREAEEERSTRVLLKEKLAVAETQLRSTRMRVSKMDRQLRESDASIANLTSTVKSLEDQSRQKEVQLEARARKLRDSLKTGEETSSQLKQQRSVLQNEVQELKDMITKITTQQKSTVQEITDQMNSIKSALEEQRKQTIAEANMKEEAQEILASTRKQIEELNCKITELENSKINPELPTEREIDIWAELQATKESLRLTEEEMTLCKREKVRFMETLTKINESDNKIGMQQKLAAELMSKEEIINKIQSQLRDLTKNAKFNEQKVLQYEQYVRDLQSHNRNIANCQEAPDGVTYQDLQQEIMNLKMSLLDLGQRNEQLQEVVMQKDQQLDQQDKTSRSQAKVIKIREELINMLKNKETEQSRELTALQRDLEHRMKIVEDVNKQIAAKADEIQELFATLETKQQQIHRLEKIVLALEEQQRRAQAQRVRNEEKIAALEHELAGGGCKRERRFLFF